MESSVWLWPSLYRKLTVLEGLLCLTEANCMVLAMLRCPDIVLSEHVPLTPRHMEATVHQT